MGQKKVDSLPKILWFTSLEILVGLHWKRQLFQKAIEQNICLCNIITYKSRKHDCAILQWTSRISLTFQFPLMRIDVYYLSDAYVINYHPRLNNSVHKHILWKRHKYLTKVTIHLANLYYYGLLKLLLILG